MACEDISDGDIWFNNLSSGICVMQEGRKADVALNRDTVIVTFGRMNTNDAHLSSKISGRN